MDSNAKKRKLPTAKPGRPATVGTVTQVNFRLRQVDLENLELIQRFHQKTTAVEVLRHLLTEEARRVRIQQQRSSS